MNWIPKAKFCKYSMELVKSAAIAVATLRIVVPHCVGDLPTSAIGVQNVFVFVFIIANC